MPQTTPFDSILTQSRDLAAERLTTAVAGMLDKAKEARSDLFKHIPERATRDLYTKALDSALAQRAEIEEKFKAEFLKEFQKRRNQANKIGESFADVEINFGELGLVGDDDLNETIKFKEISTKLGRFCEEELGALDQRAGVLLGDADLDADGNPFSPQAICDAYMHTCRHLHEDANARGVYIKLFDDFVIDEVRSIYKAVNDLLVENSILPKIRYGAPRKKEGKAAAGGKDEGDESAKKPGGEQDFFAALQSILAAKGGGAGLGGGGGPGAGGGGGGGTVVIQGAELLSSLTRLQQTGASGDLAGGVPGAAIGGMVGGMPGAAIGGMPGTANVLHELKSSSVGTSMAQVDTMTLDIVAMLFDQLFDDPQVPIGVKGLIGRLQIPVLKVAIADKVFFSKKNHPARELLDTLGEIALRLPADFDQSNPLFARLAAVIQDLLDGFQDNVDAFETARQHLFAVLAEEDRRVEEETRVVAEQLEQSEDLAAAKTAAQVEVTERVQGHSLPGAVLEFLIEQWLKLLLLVHVKDGKDSPEWAGALETMDQLVWSIEPKTTLEERRSLATVVPSLLKQLASGLRTVGAPDQVRENFFAALMKYHTEALTAKSKPAEGESAGASSAVPDFSGSVTVKNPFGGGDIEVRGLESAAGEREGRETVSIDDLKMGIWAQFSEPGSEEKPRPARLIFVSPRKTRYLFADRNGKVILQFTQAEMLDRLRSGQTVILDEAPAETLFDRIMNGVMGKMRGPAAA